MKRPIAISLSPNTEPDDIQCAREVLSNPASWQDETILENLTEDISGLFGGRPVTLTSSGRQALWLLLKDSKISAGDEVIIQAFTCIAVPAAIIWAGAQPVYADIKQETFNFDPDDVRKKITSKTRAIIIQHTFGIPGPIDELKIIAQEHNILLIEDCAHALGVMYQGKLLGTFGDAAFLSFGRDKMLSCVFGGAIIGRVVQNDLPWPPKRWVKQQLTHPILFSKIIPWYFLAGLGKITLVAAQQFGLLSKAVTPEEKLGQQPDHLNYRLSAALAHLLQLQLKKLERYTARRHQITKQYQAVFGGYGGALLRYPLLRENAAEILRAAREKKMLFGDWYNSPLAPADANPRIFGYETGMFPQAEHAAKHVLNLPTYPAMTDEQVRHVINFVKSYGHS